MVGVQSSVTVWKPGEAPKAAPARRGSTGRPRKLLQRDAKHQPVSAKKLAVSLPADTAPVGLVHLAKPRWIIERDYQELKQELGLGHYEGGGWRGFHHHATLSIAAYGFPL
jgi:SRSO17 transposase